MCPTLRLAINSYNCCFKLIQSGVDGRYHINAILANQIFQDLHCIVCNFKLGFLNKIIDFLLNLIQIDPTLTSSPNLIAPGGERAWHTHMQPVGKCSGNETLEMLPHSTRKCNKLLSRKLPQRPLKVEDTTDAIYRFVKGLYRIPKGSSYSFSRRERA